MPKARPLPSDPQERARLLLRRKAVVASVSRWRTRHPARARRMWRLCKAMQRLRLRHEAMRHAGEW